MDVAWLRKFLKYWFASQSQIQEVIGQSKPLISCEGPSFLLVHLPQKISSFKSQRLRSFQQSWNLTGGRFEMMAVFQLAISDCWKN